jgi:outer membrane protein assembly factor BamB
MVRRATGWFVLLLTVIVLDVRNAEAQISANSKSKLPAENELGQLGLTRSWWGQAVTNSARDTVSHLTCDEESVYVQTSSGVVSSFDAETGKRKWSTQMGLSDRPSFPVAINDDLVLSVNGMTLNAVDKNTGDIVWTLKLPGQPASSPAVDQDYLFLGFLDGSLYAFDMREIRRLYGKKLLPEWGYLSVLWRYKSRKSVSTPAVITNRLVAFASEDGTLYSVTKRDRDLLFQFETDAALSAPPAVFRDSLLLASQDFKVYSIGVNNGRYNWQFATGEPILAAPMVVGNEAYITPEEGGLLKLRADIGRPMWSAPAPGVYRVVSIGPSRIYGVDRRDNLMVVDRRTGAIERVMRVAPFSRHVVNNRSDRIFLATTTGLVTCLHEVGRDFPMFHLRPDRQPILPEIAPEEDESAAMPEAEMPADAAETTGEPPAAEDAPAATETSN